MKLPRSWKVALLMASSGVLLQLGSCLPVVIQIVGQQILSGVLRTVINAIVPDSSSTTTTP
ncbi:MAG: hypothetical protein U1D55_12875 [Phycisphaerae bacterium]